MRQDFGMRVVALSAAFVLLILLAYMPVANGDLGTNHTTQYLVCSGNENCSLNYQQVGDSVISGEERQASPFSPITIDFSFSLQPAQQQIVLLPEMLEEMQIDLRIQEDPGGFLRPDLHVELILGPSTNTWVIDGGGQEIGTPEPYTLQSEPLNLGNGRLLGGGDMIQLNIAFDIDQPVTWELYLAGDSWFTLPIEWSIDPNTANVDEPSSAAAPRELSGISQATEAALIGNDVDCFEFNIDDQLASFTLFVEWDSVPVEVEQDHRSPEMLDANGRPEPAPSVRTRFEGSMTINEIHWIKPEGGDTTICWTGTTDRYQTYRFLGRQSLLGIGGTTPEDFIGESKWESGVAQAGYVEQAESPTNAGVGTMVAATTGLVVAIGGFAMSLSSPWLPRFFLPLSVALLLSGGIISPTLAMTNAMPVEGESTLEELIDLRLDRIRIGVESGDNGSTGPLWYGGFFALAPGESLRLRFDIEKSHPLGDGRWQIHPKQMQNLDYDKIIFGYMNEHLISEENQVRFIMRAGRLLTLDLILLESLLVVDHKPFGKVAHIDWEMIRGDGYGDSTSPAWTSRPAEITTSEWTKLTRGIIPELLSVSLCECGIDSLEVSIRPAQVTSDDLATPQGITIAEGLFPSDVLVAFVGIGVLMLAATVEWSRRKEAMNLADDMLAE